MRRQMFGSIRLGRAEHRARDDLAALLCRSKEIDPVTPLIAHLTADEIDWDLDRTAIGFDTNALLRVVSARKSYEIIDYFGTERTAPTVLPGQSIQEFWNNQSKVYGSISGRISSEFGKLSKTVDNIDGRFDGFVERFETLLSEFKSEFQNVFDEEEQRLTRDFFSNLQKYSIVSFAPRGQFGHIAEERLLSKTPPGFEDGKPGDFYVWIDFLFGIRKAQLLGRKFDRVVLVSNEKKIDWTRAGFAHPILVSEVKALVNVPFEVWDLDKLVRKITEL